MSLCNIYKYITIYYATPSFPVLTTREIPAEFLLGQNTVIVTIFWPLNVEIKSIKHM